MHVLLRSLFFLKRTRSLTFFIPISHVNLRSFIPIFLQYLQTNVNTQNLIICSLCIYPWAVYCEGPPSFIWGKGEGGEPKKGGTIIPVYKWHTHSNHQKDIKIALKRPHIERSVGADRQKCKKMQKKYKAYDWIKSLLLPRAKNKKNGNLYSFSAKTFSGLEKTASRLKCC